MKSAGPSASPAQSRPRANHAPAPDRARPSGAVPGGNLGRARAAHADPARGPAPLPSATRSRAEAALGVPLSAIRLERDSAEPGRMGAVALSVGPRIQLAPAAGEADLVHELVHAAQGLRHGTAAGAAAVDRADSPAEAEARQLAPHVLRGSRAAVRRPRDAAVHRKPPDKKAEKKEDPEFVITPVGMNPGALGSYPALRDALDPGDWNALSAAARRRGEKVAAGGQPPPAETEAVKNEVKVPLQKLFRPSTALGTWETGGDAFIRDMYRLGLGPGGSPAMAARLQREILGRWLETESGILAEDVTVALVDPDAKGGGPSTLLFSLRGMPIATPDGSLLAAEVDKALDNNLPGIVATVQAEISGLELAVNTAQKAQSTLQAVRDMSARGDADIAYTAFDEADAALRARAGELGKVSGEPYASLVGPLAADVKAAIDTELPARRKAHEAWRAANPRAVSGYEMRMNRVEKRMKEIPTGFAAITAAYESQGDASLGFQAMVTGGAAEQERQLGKAYDQGKISFHQFEEAADAVSTRGWIFAGVTVALMIATAGLGMVALPAEAGFGTVVAFSAGAGIVSTATPMLLSNLYTSAHDLSDPAMQQWWKDTSYSGWDIAKASAMGGALGAAFPIAGKALGSLFGGAGAGTASRLIAGELAMPEGVVARTIGKDAVELTVASEGVTMEVTKEGIKVFGPAGEGKKVLLSSAAWEDMNMAPPRSGEPMTLEIAGHSAGLNFGDRGWGMVAPTSRTPVQFGLWPELALPAPEANAALVPGNMPVPVEGPPGTSMVYSGGTGPPTAQPQPILGPGAPSAPFGLLPPLLTGPPWLALPPGPQPFGLLPAPPPQITYVGPITPPGFDNPTALTTPFQQFGSSILPPTAPGGLFVVEGSGAPRYVAYPGSPGFGGGITGFGGGGPQDFLVSSGGFRSGLVQPNPITFGGGRGYPMGTPAMRFGGITLARSHVIPHADTKAAQPGQMLSTRDPNNYLGHPRVFNERIRRTMENRFRREGTLWGAYDVVGQTPRLTQGGFIVPDGEYLVQFAPDGKIWRAWYFPFDNLNAYNGLGGDFDTMVGRFAIDPAQVPTGKIGK